MSNPKVLASYRNNASNRNRSTTFIISSSIDYEDDAIKNDKKCRKRKKYNDHKHQRIIIYTGCTLFIAFIYYIMISNNNNIKLLKQRNKQSALIQNDYANIQNLQDLEMKSDSITNLCYVSTT